MANQCTSKAIASYADYISRKTQVDSLLPALARDLGDKYSFIYSPLTDSRPLYNDVYVYECIAALMQYLYGANVTPGGGGAPQNTPLSAVHLYAPTSIFAGDQAMLIADPVGGGQGLTYSWNVGTTLNPVTPDGAIQMARFSGDGTFTVKVSVSDGATTVNASANIEVKALPTNTVPTGDDEIGVINVVASQAVAGSPVLLVAMAQQGTNIQWTWDMGDGSPPTNGQFTSHIYNDIGTHIIKLTATNSKGTKRYVGPDGQEGYKLQVIADPAAAVYDSDVTPDDIRFLTPDPVYTNDTYDFGAYLDSKVVQSPQWAWCFNPVDDNGNPVSSGDKISARFWTNRQVDDYRWNDGQEGSKVVWVRLVYGPANARRTVYLSEYISVVPIPKAGAPPPSFDTDVAGSDIRISLPSPFYTGINYDFGATLPNKSVERPTWYWAFEQNAASGDQVPSNAWLQGQIGDHRWDLGKAGQTTIWVRLDFGPANARKTVYTSTTTTLQELPGQNQPAPGATYDSIINPQDITVPLPEKLYVGVEYQFAAFLETKRAENPDWWFTFDPMDNNSQPIESGTQIDRRVWQAGQVEDHTFKDGQDGPHWVWVKLEYGATNARQTVYEKFGISVKKLPGSDQPTIQPLSAGDLRFIVLPQSAPFVTEQMNDPKAAPAIHAGEFAVMYVDSQNRPFPPGTSFAFTLFTGGSEIDTSQPYAALPYAINTTPPPTDTATVVVTQPGAPAITLTRPITIVSQALSGKPLAAADLAFYAYPPEYPTARITEFGLNNKPFPVKIGTRFPLMIRTRLGKTFPPNTRFSFSTDIKYGNWVPTQPTIGVPAYICDLTGADGDTTKPVTSQPGPYHAYATIRQPGADDITLTIPLDLQAADAPVGTPVDANSMKLAVYPPNIKEPGEIVSYLTSDKPMPIKAGTRVPIMIATLKTFPLGTTFTFGTTLILEGKVPHFVPIHIPIYLMDLSAEDGSQAGTQKITVTISQPGAADITLSRSVFYQTVDPPAPPDTNPVSPWEIDLKAQDLRGGIVNMNRLEPGMTYYLLPEITGRNVRGYFQIVMGLDSQLYDTAKDPASPAATFVWLDGDPKDTSRHHFYIANVSPGQSPEDFNPRTPDVDDKQAINLITDGQGRGPDDRFMYFAVFYPQDENGKVGDPIARGFYPQSVAAANIIAGLPGEPDQSAAITLGGQPPQGYVMNTEYTLTAGVKRGYVVAGDFTYMWVIGEPSDTAPNLDPRVWQAADSNGRFVVKFDQSMVVDPDDPNYKNLKFKLWLKLVIHHKDGHDSQTIGGPFILLANPG